MINSGRAQNLPLYKVIVKLNREMSADIDVRHFNSRHCRRVGRQSRPTAVIRHHNYLVYYVAAKATYIRLLHGKIGFFGFFSALAP